MQSNSAFVPVRSSPRAAGRTPALLGLQAKELAVLALYIAMVGVAVAFYQQSEDAGRAWMLCRSFSLHDMLFHILRFEGHPGLYYLCLWGLYRAGLPFIAINWVFAAVASASTYLLLRFSPFPFYLRALIPFGFVLGYQYAVDARSYVLFPLLGFSAVHLYRRVPAQPAATALALGLLANVSLHATMVALGFAAAYAIQLIRMRREGSLSRASIAQSWAGAGIFAASILCVAICVLPLKYVNGTLPEIGKRIVHRLTGLVSYQPVRRPDAALRLVAFSLPPKATPSANVQGPSPKPIVSPLYLALVYPISVYPVLAVLYEGLVALLLLQRRRLSLLLPFALLAYFLVSVFVQIWHVGLIWVTLLLILWAVWDREVRLTDRNLQNAIAGLLTLLCVLQLPWTFRAILYERHHATYPARAAAVYLKTLPPSSRIDGNEVGFNVMPFFPRYIFLDDGPARFTGHQGYPADIGVPEFIAERPDVLLLPSKNVTTDDLGNLGDAGYRERHRFCGAPYFPNWPIAPICISAFEKNQTSR